ncbi:MAG: hypothetical protein IT536_07450 [Hyphomicrobiales bacterium]|nr:hypothetical protein [Hyphomicrobiales bacterium]
MTLAATFLGGAKSRLLPASVPFRYFGTAVVCHLLIWLLALVHPEDVVRFRGGLGPGLAAVHLLTFGVLTITAIGASAQLLPVATRRALPAVWPITLVFWIVVPALAAMLAGMYLQHIPIMIGGAVAAVLGLLLFAAILADNLRRAGSLGVVGVYGWAALLALLALIAFGVLLALDYHSARLPNHAAAALAHLILGGFGFMGMLVFGFSQILVPMFALAGAPARRASLLLAALANAALVLGIAGALAGSGEILTVAAVAGLIAACWHLWLMRAVLRGGMRKRLGLSFVLVRTAWAMLPATLVVGLAALHGFAGANGPTLFGFLLFAGWLLTFLLGILQRIIPFLASMHATRSERGVPLSPSQLAGTTSLKLHAACHALALAGGAAAIVLDNPTIMRAGAAVGLVGALAYAWFMADVVRRLLPRFQAS